MARPAKNNCDYFSHDNNMRDHKKVKALRSKFGIQGYALWCMLLEKLTGEDGNVFQYSQIEFELMAGDFGVSATEIRDTVDYCISLEMLVNDNGFVSSESLDERLAAVYLKRGKAKELSKKQQRENGKFTSRNTDDSDVSVTEMPQSKVKESTVNESKKKKSVNGAADAAHAQVTFEERKKTFMERVAENLDTYPKEMLREFFDHWTEKNDGGRKMRFEMERVFDIKKRLVTWKKNESKFNRNGSTKKRESTADLMAGIQQRIMHDAQNGGFGGGV